MGWWIPPPSLKGQVSQPLNSEKMFLKNLWLFNITADPTEQNNLSDIYPNIIKQLLDRLDYYNSTAVPCRFPEPDPLSDPALHGGAWSPWQD